MFKPALVACVLGAVVFAPAAAAATEQQISVNGTGAAAVSSGATNAQQQAAYARALSAAVTDAQGKASSVAQQLSLTLGAVQSFTELSDDYLGYCGIGLISAPAAAPIAGRSAAPSTSLSAASRLKPIPPKHKKHRHRRAHKSQSESACQIEADVTLVYGAS